MSTLTDPSGERELEAVYQHNLDLVQRQIAIHVDNGFIVPFNLFNQKIEACINLGIAIEGFPEDLKEENELTIYKRNLWHLEREEERLNERLQQGKQVIPNHREQIKGYRDAQLVQIKRIEDSK